MPIYWSFLALSYILLFFAYKKTKFTGFVNSEEVYKTPVIFVLLPVAYVALFVCLRDEVLDTYFYIGDFKNMPTNWLAVNQYNELSGSKGFHTIMALFKMYVSEDYYLWLTFMGGISLYTLFRFYKRHSCNFALTFFLFISSTAFSWLINGARQFLAVCILMGFIDWLLYGNRKQRLKYIVIALFLTTVHSSVWFVVPLICVCTRGKILDKWMFLVVVCAIAGTWMMGGILEAASVVMNKDYDMSMSTGSSVIRLAVSAVPLVFVFLKRHQIRKDATPMITFAINMSLVGVCFYFAATFSSGILVGRMPVYFTMYNYILLPWLLKKYYSNILISAGCIFCYTIFFYYQMCIAWQHLDYTSKILGLQYLRY